MKQIYKTIATGFGSGYAPLAPGTAGSILACLLLWGATFLIEDFQRLHLFFLGIIIIFTFLGVWAAKKLEKDWGKDPSKVVVDEMVGQWINLLFIPITFQNIILGLIIFRFFDIVKPLGIRSMESCKNGWGVMLDDILAGIYGNIVLQLIGSISGMS